MPDPTIPSSETGTRHRTAERVAKQTGALVVSISQQRETVTIFQARVATSSTRSPTVLAKTNQALGTLETYRLRLEQGLTRLTALEFQGAVTLDDVLVVLQRAEMTTRMVEEIERDCVELGAEGRLIRMQLDERSGRYPREKAAVVNDYPRGDEPAEALLALERPRRALVPGTARGRGSWGAARLPADDQPLDHSSRPAATGCCPTSRGCLRT